MSNHSTAVHQPRQSSQGFAHTPSSMHPSALPESLGRQPEQRLLDCRLCHWTSDYREDLFAVVTVHFRGADLDQIMDLQYASRPQTKKEAALLWQKIYETAQALAEAAGSGLKVVRHPRHLQGAPFDYAFFIERRERD